MHMHMHGTPRFPSPIIDGRDFHQSHTESGYTGALGRASQIIVASTSSSRVWPPGTLDSGRGSRVAHLHRMRSDSDWPLTTLYQPCADARRRIHNQSHRTTSSFRQTIRALRHRPRRKRDLSLRRDNKCLKSKSGPSIDPYFHVLTYLKSGEFFFLYIRTSLETLFFQ